PLTGRPNAAAITYTAAVWAKPAIRPPRITLNPDTVVSIAAIEGSPPGLYAAGRPLGVTPFIVRNGALVHASRRSVDVPAPALLRWKREIGFVFGSAPRGRAGQKAGTAGPKPNPSIASYGARNTLGRC